MIKKISIIIVIILALPLVAALFVSNNYAVEREVTINRSKTEVFNYIKQLKNQDNYSKWANIDPTMEKSYRGTDATVGFVSAWHSNNEEVGTGEQEIIKITEGKQIDYELRFISPFESTSPAYMATIAMAEQQTKVVWGFEGHMDYPTNLMLAFMDFEKIIGDDLQTGLDKLKIILESNP
ncbi:SRPBCC family protein [Colwellia sp. MSW7]|uniref:SRPBCC family protein n=1 Tax=Colwellia maritima TaxID=2912588 RepID=A0ABS9X7M4_9GAMM|nr:SRPBCC family protein [Colwellia maritima]MCI2285491.1 SRPBCC family protein [Colwellia maritima]